MKEEQQRIREILRQIAQQEGISEEEVREQIAYAISLALQSENPKAQQFWRGIPCEGESPTIEEIINHIILNLPLR